MLGFNLAVGFSIGNFPLFCPRAQILMRAPVMPLPFFRKTPAVQTHVSVLTVGVFAIMCAHVFFSSFRDIRSVRVTVKLHSDVFFQDVLVVYKAFLFSDFVPV